MLCITLLPGCSSFDLTGMPDCPDLPTVSNLDAAVQGHDIVLSWNLPNTALPITGVRVIPNGNTGAAVTLDPDAGSYTVVGQPMAEEYFYTVKLLYEGDYVSEGVSVTAVLPYEALPGVTDLQASVTGRTVSLSWKLPASGDITGVRIYRDGETDAAITLPAGTESYDMKAQPMDKDLTYTVEALYNTYYPSVAANVKVNVPYIAPKFAFLLLANSVSSLPDDDERAAAEWFAAQPNTQFVSISDLATLDPAIYPVLWVMVDRVNLPIGWQNLPGGLADDSTISALKAYSQDGGALYLSNMATQLTVPLEIVPSDWAPTVYGNGAGGTGTDVWTINPFLGWDFKDGSADGQGFYDRTESAIFKDITLEDPNGYGYNSVPLIGPGEREDHNCLWDCNIYGRGSQADVIRNFEVTTNSLVLATWGHVRDHCVAGLVDFYANANHGRCVANGFAAYEFNQNSGINIYQHNVEQLTRNILDYLAQ